MSIVTFFLRQSVMKRATQTEGKIIKKIFYLLFFFPFHFWCIVVVCCELSCLVSLWRLLSCTLLFERGYIVSGREYFTWLLDNRRSVHVWLLSKISSELSYNISKKNKGILFVTHSSTIRFVGESPVGDWLPYPLKRFAYIVVPCGTRHRTIEMGSNWS